jgi:glycosyltransferase involved in cell wall biosynthesis
VEGDDPMGDKISIVMHAFCDEDDFNAQNLNAREIACRLNPNLFEVALFYCTRPDERLRNKKNIHLIKVPNYKETPTKIIAFFSVLKHLLGKYDIFFYVRRFRVDHLYLQTKRVFGDKKITIHTIENPAPSPTNKYYNKRAKEIALSSDYVYSVSKYVAETAEKNYGIKTPVIYVGVDTQVFKPMKIKRQEKSRRLKVLYCGSFQHRKRPYLVIEAVKRFPNVEFHLIGSGPLEPSLVKAKRKLETSNVYLHGRVPLEKLVSWMREADIFLFPSIHEGFPKVTIEAAATGTPSIVFDNYKPETVLNGETGFIVRDIDEMMKKLEILIENADLRTTMGVKAREYAKKFDWNVITKQWEKEFTAVLEKAD